MIKIQNQINFIDLLYMRKKYGHIYNQDSIQHFSYHKFKKTFVKEDQDLVKKYNIYVINQYIKKNYQSTVTFLHNFKKILKKTKVQLLDLDEQELQLLEERVFSTKRHIKTLSTDFILKRGEKVGIKFIDGKNFQKTKNKWTLVNQGQLLISNYQIIFIGNNKTQIFDWKLVKSINYSEWGFEFVHKNKIFLLSIHDSESLNNTIKNFMPKINNIF